MSFNEVQFIIPQLAIIMPQTIISKQRLCFLINASLQFSILKTPRNFPRDITRDFGIIIS
ncbi:MAG: hypothetical protein UT09_C0017G0011 [Parcubacteria group bacterium GW2011_GWF2_38_8]|nr:MAG: hypothetical protein UT09_C0017G0011 [Parcubacteria group bacterium GW2011_GWF2_38_8]